MSKYRILLLLACLLVAFSGYCTELGNLVQNAYGESPSTTQSPTPTGANQQKNSNGSGDSSINWTIVWTAVTALATVVIGIFTALLWEETKLSRLNKALLESLSLLREKQQLYNDCLEAKKSFMQVSECLVKEPALVNFTHYCEFFENKLAETAGVIFPKGIRDQIEELSTSVKSFCIKDKQKSEKPQEWTGNQENEYSALRLEVSKGLDKVVNAIKEHIQAQIDGKEQTSEGTN
jgi:hypothetical protein